MTLLSAEEVACGAVEDLWFHVRTYIVIIVHNHWVSEPHSGERSLR